MMISYTKVKMRDSTASLYVKITLYSNQTKLCSLFSFRNLIRQTLPPASYCHPHSLRNQFNSMLLASFLKFIVDVLHYIFFFWSAHLIILSHMKLMSRQKKKNPNSLKYQRELKKKEENNAHKQFTWFGH